MTFIPEGFAEVTVQINIPGDAGPAFNIFGVQRDPLASAEDIAINVADTLNNVPGYTQIFSNQATIELITVRNKLGDGSIQIHEETANFPGTNAGAVAPPQVAVLLQKSTGLAGRSNRGRMYAPAIVETQIDDAGRILAANLAGMQNAANNFLADLSTNNVPMVILHDSPALAPTTVTALNVAPVVATQRRRLR